MRRVGRRSVKVEVKRREGREREKRKEAHLDILLDMPRLRRREVHQHRKEFLGRRFGLGDRIRFASLEVPPHSILLLDGEASTD